MAGSARAVEREPRIRPKYTRPFSSREVGSGNETNMRTYRTRAPRPASASACARAGWRRRRARADNMVVFAGIAVLCLGALAMRYLHRWKCDHQCSGEPSPDTLKIIVSYYPGLTSTDNASTGAISRISQNTIQALHSKFKENAVSQIRGC